MKAAWPRLLGILALLVVVLTLLALSSGSFGGPSGFLWVLKHGAAGPFAVVLLHEGKLQLNSILLGVALLGGLVACCCSQARWLFIVSAVCALMWIFVGLSVGV